MSVTSVTSARIEVETVYFDEQPDGSILPVKETGFIEPAKSSGLKTADIVRPKAQNDVLKVNFVDVQQGDGTVIESPDGKVILVDGGDNQLFARYLAGRFRGTTAANPKDIECILVTHGDADHFAGLPEILKSETNTREAQAALHPAEAVLPQRHRQASEHQERQARLGRGPAGRDAQGRERDLPHRAGGQPPDGAGHGDERARSRSGEDALAEYNKRSRRSRSAACSSATTRPSRSSIATTCASRCSARW